MRKRNFNIKIYKRKYEIKNMNVKKKKIEEKDSKKKKLSKRNDKINIKKLNNDRFFFQILYFNN